MIPYIKVHIGANIENFSKQREQYLVFFWLSPNIVLITSSALERIWVPFKLILHKQLLRNIRTAREIQTVLSLHCSSKLHEIKSKALKTPRSRGSWHERVVFGGKGHLTQLVWVLIYQLGDAYLIICHCLTARTACAEEKHIMRNFLYLP